MPSVASPLCMASASAKHAIMQKICSTKKYTDSASNGQNCARNLAHSNALKRVRKLDELSVPDDFRPLIAYR
ncbi:MAG: hypothetical protein LC793_23505, partial [Thermomicrobia bacterium]|nr:hypothetical protein [Thermomicrobia bacterium]